MKHILTIIGLATATLAGANAADLYWNGANNSASPAAGGTGSWNTASNWRTGSDTGAQATWSGSSNAILAGTSGTITINTSTVSAGTVTVNTNGDIITSSATTRGLAATSLVLGTNVGLELNTNSGTGGSGSVWTLGGISFGSGASLTVSGAASSANANKLVLNTGTTISGGSITLAGTGAGVTGFVSSVGAVNINTVITNNSTSSATELGASSTGSLTMGAKVTGSAGLQFGGTSSNPTGGAGTITLNVANDYTGATIFNAANSGVVKFGIDNALPTGTDVTMAASTGNGGILDLNGHNQEIASLTSGAGGGSITNSGSGTGTNALKISGSSSPAAFGLAITDGATAKTALTRSGTGTTTLSGTSTYTGGTTILGGVLSVTGDAQLGTAPGAAADNITINGGRLEITGTAQTLNANRNILLGSTAGTSISTKSGSGTVTFNGTLKDLTSGGILVKQGADTLALGGASAYTGATAINNGILQLTTGNDRLPTGTVVSLGQAASTNVGSFDLNGRNQQIAGLNSTTGTAITGNNTVTSSTAATLTIGGSGTYSYGSNTANNTGIITGAVSVVKQGSGSQTLGGVNTYTGNTTISAGTLLINGSTASSSAVAVNSGGTLGGNGTVNGSVSVASGGTLSPGNSPGLLTQGATTLNGGGNYNWQVVNATGAAGTGYDSISLTAGSALTLNNTSGNKFNINLWSLSSTGPDVNGDATNFNNASNYTWTLIATDQPITGFSADKFAINAGAINGTSGFSNSLAGTFSVGLADSNTDLVLNYTYVAIPEPKTWLLIGIGTTFVLYRRRRLA